MPSAPPTSPTLPVTLKLAGRSVAGAGFRGRVGRGEAVRIFTGAPVPEGADLIVIQENADEGPGSVTVREASGEPHIRPRGQDFAEGEVLLTAGTRLGPRELMLAAAMNQVDLPVRRKPKVAILATGNEVVPPGSDLAADQIVSSVPSGLAALVARHGGEAMPLGIAQDEPESILALARAGSGADILVTIGGASVGEYDLVASALKSEGLELDFWKIAMRPGKPLSLGGWASKGCSACRGTRSRRSSAPRSFSCRCSASCSGLPRSGVPCPRRFSARRFLRTVRASITCGRVRNGARTARGS